MNKIIIVGVAGAGKTTLARKMSNILDIPHIELDGIYNQPNWQHIDKIEFAKKVGEITKNPEWIFCGNYFKALGVNFWKQADTVIWCDYSFFVVLIRLLKRTFRRSITKEALWNGNREKLSRAFFTKDSIFLMMFRTWRQKKLRYSKLFSNPDDFPNTKLIRLKNSKDTEEFIDSLVD